MYLQDLNPEEGIKNYEAAHENEPRLAVPSCHGRR